MIVRQAIFTKFLPVTNQRPSRVKAIAEAGTLTLSWDHGLNPEQNHARVAEALAVKFGWRGDWYAGAIPGTSGFVFVCHDDRFIDDTGPMFRTAQA